MIPVYKPEILPEDIELVSEALGSTWVSSGEYNKRVSALLSEIFGKFVLLTSNGTSATHLLAHAIKHENPNITRILVPDNVYVAAWNSMIYGPKFELVPVQADLRTWNIDVDRLIDTALKYDPNDTAILTVHNLGNPVNVPRLRKELQDFIVIEDNCEGIFGRYEGKLTGTECLASSLSFYGNKSITCGEGGAVITGNEELYKHLVMLHGQGQSETRFVHNYIGYNYRMTNMQAAILYGQLRRYKDIMARKERIYRHYQQCFKNKEKLQIQFVDDACNHSYWMFGVRILCNPSYKAAEKFFNKRNIDIRPMFYPMSKHNGLAEYANEDSEGNARLLNQQCVILPSYPSLDDDEISQVVNAVLEYIG